MGWNRMGWDGMEWNRMGWDGIGWDVMGWDAIGLSFIVAPVDVYLVTTYTFP